MTNCIVSEIDHALTASQDILTLINNGEWDKVQECNDVRMKLIRSLSMCKKNASFWQKYCNKLSEIKRLDDCIVTSVNNMHRQTLSSMFDQQVKKHACVQYLNQKNNS